MREKKIFRSYLQDDVIDGVDKKTAGFLTLVQKQTNCSKL